MYKRKSVQSGIECAFTCTRCSEDALWFGVNRSVLAINFRITYPNPESTHCTLQHSATHCNTLQHTATYCNTLQHMATHCNTVQHGATHCNTLQHTATYCNTLQHMATHCNTVQHGATHCNTLQHTATYPNHYPHRDSGMLTNNMRALRTMQCVAVCCSVLQCVAVCLIRVC